MGIGSAVAIYFVIWWICFYPVLTLGDRAPDLDAGRVQGADRGAPARAGIGRKVVLTTVLATVVFAAVYAVLSSGLTLEDIPLPGPPGLTPSTPDTR